MKEDYQMKEIYNLLGINNHKTIKELIEDKKEELKISSDRQLSKVLGINKDTLNRIITGESKKVDIISIIKISNFLDLKIEDTIQVYVSTLKTESISEIEDNRKANFILRNFDIERLYKLGFLKTKTNFEEIEKRILNFFKIDNIFDYNNSVAYPLFSKTKMSADEVMNTFWIKAAYLQFEAINNPNEFDPEELKKIVTKIRPYTRLVDNGLITVIKALYSLGVTVIVQKYVSKTAVKGATFIVDNKPCIILTDQYERYDLMWFTLLHEICHVLFDFDELSRKSYHLSGASDLLLLNEERANKFAREILFPEERMNFLKPNIFNPFLVSQYAEQNNVHPSIIYGFYLHDHPQESSVLYKKFNRFLIKSEMAVRSLKTNLWDTNESPADQARKIIEKISN